MAVIILSECIKEKRDYTERKIRIEISPVLRDLITVIFCY